MPSQKPPAPYAPPAVVLLHWHRPMSCFLCESPAYSFAMPDHTKAATLCCGLHGLPLAVPLCCTFKSGQAIPALTQQAKGAGGGAGQQ